MPSRAFLFSPSWKFLAAVETMLFGGKETTSLSTLLKGLKPSAKEMVLLLGLAFLSLAESLFLLRPSLFLRFTVRVEDRILYSRPFIILVPISFPAKPFQRIREWQNRKKS